MADEIDIANKLIEDEVSLAISRMRQNAHQSETGSEFCVECGEEIPAARQKLGFMLCVPCASETERKKSLYAE